MKKYWLSSAAILPVVLVSPALAGAPVPYSWTGFYVGANAGGTWGRYGSSSTTDCNAPAYTPPLSFSYVCWTGFPGDAANLNAVASGTVNASGFTGGLQAGYNWQVASFVTGLESDFGAFSLRGSRTGDGIYATTWSGTRFSVTTTAQTDWLFTFRGRVGVTVLPNLLAYATGGLAVTRVGVSTSYVDTNSFFPTGISGAWSGSSIRTGYAIGAGAEYALPNNWTLKAEYLYLDFGSINTNGTIRDNSGLGYSQAISTRTDVTANIARLGINRRF